MGDLHCGHTQCHVRRARRHRESLERINCTLPECELLSASHAHDDRRPASRRPNHREPTAGSPSPDCVYLFGSHARGEAGPDSDMDFLVVVPGSAKTRYERAVEALRFVRDIEGAKEGHYRSDAGGMGERDQGTPARSQIPSSGRESLFLMAPESFDLASAWMAKARSDLDFARILPRPFF